MLFLQEKKWLGDHSGLVFNHTFGNTLRGGKRKNNTSVAKKCEDSVICPVIVLQLYK